MDDIQTIIIWCTTFFLLGIAGLPLTAKIFHNWSDKGYIFAKFIGLFLVAMPLWLLSSLKIVQFTQASTWVFFLAVFIPAGIYLYKKQFRFNKLMLLEEAIFLIVLVIWASIRSYNSQIQGTEKFMNLAIMNSVFRSEYFPPLDMWYSGGTINYYYLGHYMFTFISKLVSISTGYGYNLALVTIIAHLFTALIAISLKFFEKGKFAFRFTFALMGASWISFGANMHYAFSWLAAQLNGTEFQYFFPNPTRIISFAIDEFPSYSIVLGDLHGHYIVLPFLITSIALLIQAVRVPLKSRDKLKFNMMLSPFIAVLYGINTWDFVTVNFAFLVIHIYQALKLETTYPKRLKYLLKAEVALIAPGFVLLAPYFLNFKPAVSGIGLVPFDRRSEVGPWILMWGMFLLISLFYAGFYLRKSLKKHNNVVPLILAFVGLNLIIGVEIFFFRDIFVDSNFDYFRTNTVFKFYYHAWIFWGIAATYFAYCLAVYIKEKKRWAASVALVIIAIFWIGCVAYIFKAVADFYPFKTAQHVSVDGTSYLKLNNLPDYNAINWINENINGQPVILEAVGEAYTYYSRITTHTGLITVMGWPTHEWQWRGDPKLAFSRADDAKLMYEATSAPQLIDLLEKYNVDYIYVGDLEREKYPGLNEDLIASISRKIYEADNTRIYKPD